jgi:alkylation response protein AidB-like acyl-CoA dehydrogenase
MNVDTYRTNLRQWLSAHAPTDDLDRPERVVFMRELYDAGFVGATWPVEYGGLGLSEAHQTAFNEETSHYPGAMLTTVVTVGICAQVLFEFGSEEQKVKHLRRMLRADETWTQMLSEPAAGSDLGSATTRAEEFDDHFVLNGQKVWTSQAHNADFAIALVRTDASQTKYAGLSMIVIDMHAKGVTVRPLVEMTGEAVFNEVFLDDVIVARENLLGPMNGGWNVLRQMLFHERMALGAGTSGNRLDRDSFGDLVEAAHNRGVIGEPAVRKVLADTYMQQRLLDYLGQRIRRANESGAEMGPIGSIAKIALARSARAAAEAAMVVYGIGATAWTPDSTPGSGPAHDLLYFPMTGIAGGTTEIQKNIVAERLIGLPREAAPDRDQPFNAASRATESGGASVHS